MGEITSSDLDNDHWATSDGVREYIEIPVKGGQKDVETDIVSATQSVQAWWKEATDGDIPGDLPDPSTIEDNHPLLVKAAELQAASEAHERHAQNFRSEEDEGQQLHVFLEHRASSKFDDWVMRKGYGTTDTVESQGASSPSGGRSSSLVDLG